MCQSVYAVQKSVIDIELYAMVKIKFFQRIQSKEATDWPKSHMFILPIERLPCRRTN
jgi:hypothetical protein